MTGAEYILIVSFCTAIRGLPVECVEAYRVKSPFDKIESCKSAAMHHRRLLKGTTIYSPDAERVSALAICKWESGNGK